LIMRSKDLCHEPFLPFQQAVRLFEAVQELACTRHHATNERLWVHAQRTLEHAACAGAEPRSPGRARKLQYCRLAMTRLAATVVAARCAKLISDEQAARVRADMLVLEDLLVEAAVLRPPPAAVVEK